MSLNLCLTTLALPACGGGSAAQRPPIRATATTNQSNSVKTPASVERDTQRAVASVLAQYLNLSIARHHESAYALLSDKDHRARA
ncbi:MAG: hypothetical protein KBG15_13750, partial [Kofleriaceae bacterium]|nr:hypothetical protein [Kofleriaceae bacterium]